MVIDDDTRGARATRRRRTRERRPCGAKRHDRGARTEVASRRATLSTSGKDRASNAAASRVHDEAGRDPAGRVGTGGRGEVEPIANRLGPPLPPHHGLHRNLQLQREHGGASQPLAHRVDVPCSSRPLAPARHDGVLAVWCEVMSATPSGRRQARRRPCPRPRARAPRDTSPHCRGLAADIATPTTQAGRRDRLVGPLAARQGGQVRPGHRLPRTRGRGPRRRGQRDGADDEDIGVPAHLRPEESATFLGDQLDPTFAGLDLSPAITSEHPRRRCRP